MLHSLSTVPYSKDMPSTPKTHTPDSMPTLPPGPADAAALEHGRQLAASGTDRSAAWWATVERVARVSGLRP